MANERPGEQNRGNEIARKIQPSAAPALELTNIPPLRRNRDFQTLWLARVVSDLGGKVSLIAYPLLVISYTGSVAKAGLVGTVQLLAFSLASLPAGILADSVNRRNLMVACEFTRAGLLLGLSFAVLRQSATFSLLISTAAMSSFLSALFDPAAAGALKQVVPPSQMSDAQTQSQVRLRGVALMGPPLGGMLYTMGHTVPFLFDSLTYLASGVALLFMRRPLQNTGVKHETSPRPGFFAGFKFLYFTPHIRVFTTFGLFANMMFAGFHLAMIATLNARGANATSTGILMAVLGAAGFLGAISSRFILRLVKPAHLIIGTAWVTVAALFGVALAPGLYAPVAIAAASLFTLAPFGALYMTYVMNTASEGIQGRVASSVQFTNAALQPIGPLAVGFLFDTGGARWTFGTMGVFTALAAAILFSRHIRNIPPLEAAANH